MKGKLYLIPAFLGSDNSEESFPGHNLKIIETIKYFIVEEERSARRFIKKILPDTDISKLQFSILNEHTKDNDITDFLKPCEHDSVGLVSEAGVPCVADPGSQIVSMAHKAGIEVIPLVGPSSILLALMASGLNGQNFAFNGYLPVQKNERIKMLKHLEKRSVIEKQTQIFIETPYRNMHLLEDIANTCNSVTLLCIACDLTLVSQFIKTRSIKEWKTKLPDIHKRPAIFCIIGNYR
jgi:16S rRNA (cytidine1402-2'-O)-methyltransferase